MESDRGGRPAQSARRLEQGADDAPLGLRALRADSRNSLRQCRRADERDRLGEVPQADHVGRLCRGPRRGPRPGRQLARRSSTSTWMRG